jgi:hypothetical protein
MVCTRRFTLLSPCSLVELVLGHHVYHEMLKFVPIDPLLDDPIGLTWLSETSIFVWLLGYIKTSRII